MPEVTVTELDHRAHPGVAVLVDLLLGLAVGALGWLGLGETAAVPVVLAAAAAAAVARQQPALALGVMWLTALGQVAVSGPVVAVACAITVVGFRTGRYGAGATVWAAGLSIPVGAAVAMIIARARPADVRELAALADSFTGLGAGVVGGFLVVAAVLGAPFAAGLLLRVNEGYRRSRVARELAERQAASDRQLAEVRLAQTALTRDVHDVVGHSLAVIIAQADAAQARLDEADDPVRAALAQIAEVGRSSLAEIRDVLARTRLTPAAGLAVADDLGELVAGVRRAGNIVEETVLGEPRSLSGDAASTSYRVLQELLTNSLKHGTPGGGIGVVRTWTADGLTLRVDNPVAPVAAATVPVDGMGLQGVRSRLKALGGTLRVGITGERSGATRFVATAFLPVPAGD